MTISMIAAIGNNRAIAHQQKIPWNLPKDYQYYLDFCNNKTVIMGRDTGKENPESYYETRNVIVLSRNKSYSHPFATVAKSVEEALSIAKESDNNIVIAGGEQPYTEFLLLADYLYITYVDLSPEADRFFPEFNLNDWIEISRKPESDNSINYEYVVYKRK